MPTTDLYTARKLDIRYWNSENRIVDAEVMALESQLSKLGEVSLQTIPSLDHEQFNVCDLLIIAGQKIPEEDFENWLLKLSKRIEGLGRIWVPALILADVSFATLEGMMLKATKQNWYFDIISAAHMSSLPIRVANLIRIHSHLRELFRYEQTLTDLEGKMEQLQTQFAEISQSEADKS